MARKLSFFLVLVFFGTVFANEYTVMFEPGCSEVNKLSDRIALRQLAQTMRDENLEPYFYGAADSLYWKFLKQLQLSRLEKKRISQAIDGGLIFSRIRAVAQVMGIEQVGNIGIDTSLKHRSVKVVLRRSVTTMIESEKETRVEMDSVHSAQLTDHEERLQEIEAKVFSNNDDFSQWETGLGVMSVYHGSNYAFTIPAAHVALKLGPKFGLQVTGGTYPTGTAYNRQMWSNAVNVGFFVKPTKNSPVKFSAGYTHVSETVEVGEWLWRADGGFVGGQADIKLGKNWKLSPSVNCLLTDDRVGVNGFLVISECW